MIPGFASPDHENRMVGRFFLALGVSGVAMIPLMRMLVRERLRRLSMNYGWACYTSICVLLLLFAWTGAAAAGDYVRRSTSTHFEYLLIALWAAWVAVAIVLGKDLSWRIQLERILVLPVQGFLRLYSAAFLLGFLSLPLITCLLGLEFLACLISGFSPGVCAAVWIGSGLYLASVRLTASLVRAALFRGARFSTGLATIAAVSGAAPLLNMGAAVYSPRFGLLLPGHQLRLVLYGEYLLAPLVCLGAYCGLLACADFVVQRGLTYSGARGPLAPGGAMMARGYCLLCFPSWPSPLFRVAVLGWLRSRNALLLLIWGVAYGFLYMYFSKPDEALDFFLFVWVVQLFHAYLRGNLLGIDRGGIWLYSMFPIGVEIPLRAKSQALSLLQGCMVLAVLAGGFLSGGSRMNLPEWTRVASYSLSSLLVGGICGIVFSVRYPEPIDRTSQFSGGTAVGALGVPAVQALFMVAFWLASALASRILAPAAYWVLLLAAPASLASLFCAIVKVWAPNAILNRREIILRRLSAMYV
jgi:hypothetical protein